MQTILGAGGVIGEELSRELPDHTDRIRQVSRTPRRVNRSDELMAADLLDPVATARAVEGSEVAYLTAGLPYDAEIWERDWPRIMDNVMEACRRHSARLVFLDNVYAYGRVRGPMTEETPFNPCSRKGEVRARIATTLLEAMAADELEAMIVRAADFYGPGAESSVTHHTVFQRIQDGKPPRWLGNPKAAHSFSFTPDVARSLALLGNRPQAYGRSWHALTDGEQMSGIRFVETACEAARVPYELQVPPGWLLWAMGLFNPVLKENREMMYQFNHNYHFDSSTTQQALGVDPTPYQKGIARTVGATPRSAQSVFLPRRVRE
jgi:nucleoside-diphosphate-sugar epimerase